MGVRNGVTACMMIAAAALLAVGAIGPVHGLILAAAVLYGRWQRKPETHARLWDLLALLTLILFPFDLVVISRDLIGAALRLLTFVVVYRCSNLSDQRDLRQAISLSFVQILAAAASTTEAYFSIFLAAYLLVAIWTLMAMAASREGAPAAARRVPGGRPALSMTASTLAIGGALFFVIPHFGTGTFHPVSILRGEGDGLTGFADRIELGSIGRIKQSRAIVMRVHVGGALDPASLPVRWRGVALDTFDGRSWSASSGSRRWVDRDGDGAFHIGSLPPDNRDTFRYEVSVLPVLVPVLFTTPGPSRIVSDDITSLGIDTDGSIHLPAPRIRRFNYRVVSQAPDTALYGYGRGGTSPSGSARYLALPRLDPRVTRLAAAVTEGAGTDFERARRIEDYLRSNYTYSLDVNDAGVADPVAHFLLEHHPGHCEYFATSMAVMLRHLGIPSRVVNGFQSGEWSALTSSFIVRQADAHAWVEAWIPERGWVTYDPTPSTAQLAARAGALGRLRAGLSRLEVMWDTCDRRARSAGPGIGAGRVRGHRPRHRRFRGPLPHRAPGAGGLLDESALGPIHRDRGDRGVPGDGGTRRGEADRRAPQAPEAGRGPCLPDRRAGGTPLPPVRGPVGGARRETRTRADATRARHGDRTSRPGLIGYGSRLHRVVLRGAVRRAGLSRGGAFPTCRPVASGPSHLTGQESTPQPPSGPASRNASGTRLNR